VRFSDYGTSRNFPVVLARLKIAVSLRRLGERIPDYFLLFKIVFLPLK